MKGHSNAQRRARPCGIRAQRRSGEAYAGCSLPLQHRLIHGSAGFSRVRQGAAATDMRLRRPQPEVTVSRPERDRLRRSPVYRHAWRAGHARALSCQCRMVLRSGRHKPQFGTARRDAPAGAGSGRASSQSTGAPCQMCRVLGRRAGVERCRAYGLLPRCGHVAGRGRASSPRRRSLPACGASARNRQILAYMALVTAFGRGARSIRRAQPGGAAQRAQRAGLAALYLQRLRRRGAATSAAALRR